jgi:hypothetical protein
MKLINNLIILGTIVLLLIIFMPNKYEGFNNYNGRVYRPLRYNYGHTNSIPNYTVFSAHPNNLVCLYDKTNNRATKYMRLNDTGHPMYTSYNIPTECSPQIVPCPPLVIDDLNQEIGHPMPNKKHKDNLVCVTCAQ